MTTTFQALVLGLLQGLSEFLPISSSAHLTLAPWFFGWPDPGLAFDVALHFGTLVAVLWYFRAEWWAMLLAARDIVRHRRIESEQERRAVYLIIATIPGGIAGVLLEKQAETVFRHPALTASALIAMGAVLWLVDRAARRDRTLAAMTWSDALIIGVSQVLALIPGVSRSGSTITAGRALRLDRPAAATFSFLMSMPIIAAAALVKLPALLRGGITVPIVVGIVSAAASSWLAIEILLRYITRRGFGIFALYRLVLGAAVFLTLALRAGR
jgi:undecaprenyl-diphosphatase